MPQAADKHPVTDVQLDLWIPFRLWVIADTLGRQLQSHYSPKFGFPRAVWLSLLVLANYAPMTAGDLSARSGLDPTRVSQALKELERRRMVSRRANSKDRRQVMLNVTPTGKKIYEQIAAYAKEGENQLLEALTQEEQNALNKIVGKLEDRVGQLFGNGSK